jgi:hypothetical protein
VLLHKSNINVLHTLGVHRIHNQFWQYPLCNVYYLWQPDELLQPLIDLVKYLLHWLLKYLQVRNVKDQLHNQFTSLPDSQASNSSLNHLIRRKVAPGRDQIFCA